MYLTTLATHYLCEMLSSITWWQPVVALQMIHISLLIAANALLAK